MAKTKNQGIINLSSLRNRVPDVSQRSSGSAKYQLDDYNDPKNLADVQQYLSARTIPPGLLPAIAPLETIYPGSAQRAAAQGSLLPELRSACQGITSFLPEKYHRDPAGIIPSQRRDQVVVQRPAGRSPRPAPLEIVVPESYRADNRLEHGVGHYVYDPLSGQWLLVARWGQGPDSNSNPITPHLRWADAARLSRQIHNRLSQQEITDIAPAPFAPADGQLVAQAQRAVRG